jgi:2-haloalkanoic acid dehalogenase type II
MSSSIAFRDRPADTQEVRLTDFDVLAFDCYGTLIDWEAGIFAALQPLLSRMAEPLGQDAALELFAREESAQQAETPAMIYSELLSVVYGRLARVLGLAEDAAEASAFGGSVPDWPAFPDSAEALAYLKQHYRLVILSNVDRESFRGSNARLGVVFDAIYTAQDVGSYKPSPRNFDYLLAKQAELGVPKEKILMTAQSLFHDHAPAKRAGLRSAWIDRRHAQDGWGATMPPPEGAAYEFRFNSMAELAAAHAAALRS